MLSAHCLEILITGVKHLAQGLLDSQVVHLDLRDCRLTSQGMHSLCEAIGRSRTLQVLRLDENRLDPEGAAALASSLGRECSLDELHISSTSMGDEGTPT